MKIHRLLVQGVSDNLTEIFRENRYADRVIDKCFRTHPKWGARDRAFVAEQTYDIVRWWRLLWELSGSAPSFEPESLFRLIGINCLLNDIELPEWTEFKDLDKNKIQKHKIQLAQERKLAQSIPDWLDDLGEKELGIQWEPTLTALNHTAQVVIRVNTFKIKKSELRNKLSESGWDTLETPLAPDALILQKRGNIFQHPLFKEGFFEVQDAGSQCIAPFLKAAPGMLVVDACAGAGGKTLHLANLMQHKGKIIALDTENWKLEELRKRARRNGVDNIETRPIDSLQVIEQLYGTADRLLLDAPCSGLGVLRRNPDAKWKLNPAFLDEIRLTQAKILAQYAPIVKPGSYLVYATCSILPSENQQQVQHFLSQEGNAFKLMEERTLLPQMEGFDGYYMALLQHV